VIQLYQAEWCPYSHRVRAKLTELGVPHETINVAAEGRERTEVEELTGNTAIPVLVDGEKVVSDSSQIVSYLEAKYTSDTGDARSQREELSPTISGAVPFSFGEALERTRRALREAQYKLLGELDLAPVLSRQSPLTILVAVEQEFAKQVADVSPGATSLGLLQISVYEQNGRVRISAIKPESAVAPIRNSEITGDGHELQERLIDLIESLGRES
jgi:glutaredoxin 3